MNADRVSVGFVAVCIVGLTLATGPAGPINIGTDTGGLDDPGTGTATVEVVSEPGAVTLEPSDDGQDVLHLSVPTMGVTAVNVTGNPILSYMISLEEIGYATDSVSFVGQGEEGERELSIDRRTFRSDEVENVTEAEISLTLRGEETVTIFEDVVPVNRP